MMATRFASDYVLYLPIRNRQPLLPAEEACCRKDSKNQELMTP
jgi:hypothetical protein